MSELQVKHYTEPCCGESARIAEVGGIKFSAMPYQPYYGRLGRYSAFVNSRLDFYYVRINLCNSDGTSTFHKDHEFDEQDEAFIWAATQLARLQ